MERKMVALEIFVRCGWAGWRAAGRSSWRICGSAIGLGLVGIFLASEQCLAQVPAHVRLTNPREMATATRTEQAGKFELQSFPRDKVYVPERCVGTRRCPLMVVLPTAKDMADRMRPAIDTYGTIVLEAWHGAEWDTEGRVLTVEEMLQQNPGNRDLQKHFDRGERHPALAELDTALQEVFRRFAIDPDKVALIGRCNTGVEASFWARFNLDLFSRIVLNSVDINGPVALQITPGNKTSEFLLISGALEGYGREAEWAEELRRDEHPVKHVIGFRGHDHQWEDYDFMVRWLHESWTTPRPADRPAPKIVAEPLPVLTTEALSQMTTFWTRFMQEPDSIRTTARRAHLREVALSVPAAVVPSTVMVDMPALSAQYPSVGLALKMAGLTAQQHEALRVALLSAKFFTQVTPGPTLSATQAKNVDFYNTHPDELDVLQAAGMWDFP